MRQTNASAAVEQDLLEVALTHERLTQARARSQRLGGLVWTGLATLLGVFLSVLIVNEIFYWTLRSEIQRKRLDPTNAILTTTRAREQLLLTEYRWLKKSDGIVRIPVKRAANLVIAEYAHPPVPVAAASASSTISASSNSPALSAPAVSPASSAFVGSPTSAASSASRASSVPAVLTLPSASSTAASKVLSPPSLSSASPIAPTAPVSAAPLVSSAPVSSIASASSASPSQSAKAAEAVSP